MKKLNVKTASTQAGKIVPVQLGTQCRRAMIKNFSAGDIWVGVTPDSTKTRWHDPYPVRGRAAACLFLCRAVWRFN